MAGIKRNSLLIGGILLLIYLLRVPRTALWLFLLVGIGWGMTLLGVSRSEFGVFCLLYGTRVLGIIANVFGVPGMGAPVGILLGLMLVWPVLRQRTEFRWGKPASWVVLFYLILLFAFLLGPHGNYAILKLTTFFIGVPIAVLAFTVMIRDENFRQFRLGMLYLSGSAVIMAAHFYLYPFTVPSDLWQPGSFRYVFESLKNEIDISLINQAKLAAVGVVLVMGDLSRLVKRWIEKLAVMISLVTGGVILYWVGRRQEIIGAMVASSSVYFDKEGSRKGAALVLILLFLSGSAIFYLGYITDSPVYSFLFEQDSSLMEKLHRESNWNSAIERIAEKPWFGHGLGGYYISEKYYSGSVEASSSFEYAHNIFLELLSELGIVGTGLVLLPLFLFFLIPKIKSIVSFRTRSHGNLLPLLILVAMVSMLSGDLRESYVLVALMVTLWAHIQ